MSFDLPKIEEFCFECLSPILKNQGRFRILNQVYCVTHGLQKSKEIEKNLPMKEENYNEPNL